MDTPRAPYLRPTFLLLVLAGGTVGTALRAGVVEAVATRPGHWPWETFAVNLVGSFLLGLLLARLRGSRWDNDRRERLWVALGTGLLGGLTTYSTFATEVVTLLRAGQPATGLGYATLSVLLGIAAALAGYLLGGPARGVPGSAASDGAGPGGADAAGGASGTAPGDVAPGRAGSSGAPPGDPSPGKATTGAGS